MTDAVKIALITAGGLVLSGVMSTVVILLIKRLEVKVDGRLTELLKANKRADISQGRQDERDSHSVTVEGVPKVDEAK